MLRPNRLLAIAITCLIVCASLLIQAPQAGAVSNGTPARIEDNSHLVFVVPNCSGVLIRPDIVVTAAHCLGDGAPPAEVLFGAQQLTEPKGNIVRYPVETVLKHEKYVNYEKGWDVAIIRLAVRASPRFKPLGLDPKSIDTFDGSVAGWRKPLGVPSPTPDLQTARAKVRPSTKDGRPDTGGSRCVVKNGPKRLLAELVDTTKTKEPRLEYGDSGGPLTRQEGQHRYLSGVLSGEIPSTDFRPKERTCQDAYTNLTKHSEARNWVDAKIASFPDVQTPQPLGATTIDAPAFTIDHATPDTPSQITFPAGGGQTVSLMVNAPPRTKVELIAPDGAVVATRDTGSWHDAYFDAIVLMSGGTYTVKVDVGYSQIGTVRFDAWDVNPVVVAKQTSISSAAVVAETKLPGQNAAFKFHAKGLQTISLLVTAPSWSQVDLVAPDGSIVATRHTGGWHDAYFDAVKLSAVPRLLENDGTYTVKVDVGFDQIGQISFDAWDVSPLVVGRNTSMDAPAVEVFTKVPGQNAAFTLDGRKNQTISATVNAPSWTGVELIAPDGSVVASGGTGGWNELYLDAVRLPMDGTYTVRVDLYWVNTGSIRFDAWDVHPLVISKQTSVSSPATYVETKAPGQNAEFTFHAKGAQTVTVDVDGPQWSAVNLVAPDGTIVASNGTGPWGNVFFDAVKLTVDGNYRVTFDVGLARTGRIDLDVWDVNPLVVSKHTSIGSGPTSVLTKAPGQNASFTFDAAAGQKVHVNVEAPVYSKVEVFDPEGTWLGTGDTMSNGDAHLGPLSLPRAGRYLVRVDVGYGAQGKVGLDVVEQAV